MKVFLEIGLDPNIDPTGSGDYKKTFLTHAVKTKDIEMCELLLKYGADINGKDKLGNSKIQYFCDSCL